jgi:hypothetical protein
VIRHIFAEFIAGTSQREIARRLNADGVKPMRAGTWSQSTVSKIVHNAAYAGTIRLNGQGTRRRTRP